MLSESQVQQFRRDGFLRSGKLVGDDHLGQLREELDRVIRDRDRRDLAQPVGLNNFYGEGGEKSVWQVVNIWEASEAYRRLVDHSAIVAEVAQLMESEGPGVVLWHDQIQYKPAVNGGTNMWHQDWPLWPILDQPKALTAWVALDDIDEDNGCMSMVPGSHRWGNAIQWIWNNVRTFDGLPSSYEGNEVRARTCPARAGEVHFHHSLTWHGSPDNRSARPRRAIALHYMAETTAYVAANTHTMKRFVESRDGEPIRGAHFPHVWRDGALQPMSAAGATAATPA